MVLGRGRFQLRFEALDYLELAVEESFGGIRIDDDAFVMQELPDFGDDPEGARRVLLTLEFTW